VTLAVGLYRRFAHLVHELAKFGSVGAIAFVITISTSNVLHAGVGMGPLTSNAIATVVATTFAYFANRYWTFRHRDRTGLGREYTLFFVLNGIGLVITELFIGFTHYVLDQTNLIAFNIAQIVGTGVATLFRYWSYKKWVFLPVTAPTVDPHTGLPEKDGPPRDGDVISTSGGPDHEMLVREPYLVRLAKDDDANRRATPYEFQPPAVRHNQRAHQR
jgi:putative flippase GtrA